MKAALLLVFAASVTGQGIICGRISIIAEITERLICNFLVSPQVWESNIFIYYQGENQEPIEVRRGKFSYDAQNLRRRFIEEIDTSRTERDYYDELYLYKEVYWKIVLINIPAWQYCNFPVKGSWLPA